METLLGLHFGQWLKDQVENRGLISEFVRTSEIPRPTLNVWFALSKPRILGKRFGQLARGLGLSPDELREKLKESDPDPLDQNVEPYSEEPWFEVPMFDLAVAAGRWVDVSELAEVREGAQIDRGYFRIHIRGDSMQPVWPDGSVVEFSVLREGQHAMEIGADYYVQRDGEATFKRLVKIDEGELVFAAVNKRKYPAPFVVARSAVVRMAKAEWMLSRPKPHG